MNEHPRRIAWFQLRLSTCVVVMVTLGFLSYFNTKPIGPAALPSFGWPAIAYISEFDFKPIKQQGFFQGTFVALKENRWVWSGVAIDVAVALLIVFLTARYSEILFRRHERNRNESDSSQ